MTDEVYTIPYDFKTTKTREMVTINEDGSYTIFINSRLSHDAQYKAYHHAMKHIKRGDFDRNNIQEIESNAHGHTDDIAEDRLNAIEIEEIIKEFRNRRAQKNNSVNKNVKET